MVAPRITVSAQATTTGTSITVLSNPESTSFFQTATVGPDLHPPVNAWYVEVTICGVSINGAEGCYYHLGAYVYYASQTATMSAVQVLGTHESDAGFAAEIDLTAGLVRARVTGLAATHVMWTAQFSYQACETPSLMDPAVDGTFARALVASHSGPRPSSILENNWVRDTATGVIRPGRPGYSVIEGATENHFPESDDFAVWTNSSTFYTAGTAIAPDGEADVGVLAWTGSANNRIYDDIAYATVTDSVDLGMSAYVRAKKAATTCRLGIANKAGTLSQSADKTVGTEWTRIFHEHTSGTGTGTTDVRASIYNNVAGDGGDIEVWRAQLEERAFPSLPVTTTSVAVTRPADALYEAFASMPSHLYSTGFWFRYIPYFSSAEHIAHNVIQNLLSNASVQYFRFQPGLADFRFRGDISFTVSSTKSWSALQVLTFVIDLAGLEVRFGGFTTGDETLDVTGAGDWSTPGTNLYFGDNSAAPGASYGEFSPLYPLASAPF